MSEKIYVDQPFLQMCYAVDDLKAACQMWSDAVGAGPWVIAEHVAIRSVTYKGETMTLDQGSAVGYWGDIEIELFKNWEPDNPAGAIAPKPGLGTLHHYCMFADDIDAEIKRMEALGYPLVWDAIMDTPMDMRIVMFDTKALNGALIEVYEENAEMRQSKAFVKSLRDNWDRKEIFVDLSKLG